MPSSLIDTLSRGLLRTEPKENRKGCLLNKWTFAGQGCIFFLFLPFSDLSAVSASLASSLLAVGHIVSYNSKVRALSLAASTANNPGKTRCMEDWVGRGPRNSVHGVELVSSRDLFIWVPKVIRTWTN